MMAAAVVLRLAISGGWKDAKRPRGARPDWSGVLQILRYRDDVADSREFDDRGGIALVRVGTSRALLSRSAGPVPRDNRTGGETVRILIAEDDRDIADLVAHYVR